MRRTVRKLILDVVAVVVAPVIAIILLKDYIKDDEMGEILVLAIAIISGLVIYFTYMWLFPEYKDDIEL